jgi:hypothetical protein
MTVIQELLAQSWHLPGIFQCSEKHSPCQTTSAFPPAASIFSLSADAVKRAALHGQLLECRHCPRTDNAVLADLLDDAGIEQLGSVTSVPFSNCSRIGDVHGGVHLAKMLLKPRFGMRRYSGI